MLKLGPFQVDCTPPDRCPVFFGTSGHTTGTRDPLYLRGFILDDGVIQCLIASLDFCALMNSAYDQLRLALSVATGIAVDHIVIHCIHQHDAPLLNFEIEDYLGCETYPRRWWQEVQGECGRAARECLERMVPVVEVGHAGTAIEGFASNRRILGSNGKIAGMRYSLCDDGSLKEKPVGTIDPMLKTIAFKDEAGRNVASMSFYATHPQVSSGRGLYSADAPGEAIRILHSEMQSCQHAFFTGASGNVTAGKYTSPTDLEGNLLQFGKILADGIRQNFRNMKWGDPDKMEWKWAKFPFPRRPYDKAGLLKTVGDSDVDHNQRLRAAVLLSCYEYEANSSYPLSLLRMQNTGILFLPGEPFVEFQLHVQSLVPDQFLAVAANCSDNFLYLPLAENFDEGGYELEWYCWCTRDFEEKFHNTLSGLVKRMDA